MRKSLKFAIILGTLGVLLILTGGTFAFFNYTRTGATNELLVGRIYFNHTQGTTISLQDEFPEKREVARTRNDNVINLSITGLNESDKDVYYKFMISHGPDVNDRSIRIDDEDLRFDLVEVLSNNEERYIAYNEKYDTINNTVILKDRILAGTNSNVTRNYKLRMWISDDVLISDTDPNRDYTSSQYADLFATITVTAKADIEDVKYYSSLDNAITAINSETYNSAISREDAKLGIYIDPDDNTTNLVLYDDVDINSNYTITKPVNINLYGNAMEFKMNGSMAFKSMIFANTFSIENGTIRGEENTGSGTFPYGIISSGSNASGILNDVDIPFVSDGNGCVVNAYDHGNMTFKNSLIDNGQVHSTNSGNYNLINSRVNASVYINSGGIMEMTDSYVEDTYANNSNGLNYLVSIEGSNSRLVVNNSTIFADRPGCYSSEATQTYMNCSIGIVNGGTLIFNSGYVFGTHSGVEAAAGSKTYVYGGTFDSTHHGGFYFAHGPSGVAYVENANIRGGYYPAQGQYRPNGTVPYHITVGGVTYDLQEQGAAFYMGGDTNQNNENLYLVNCNIDGKGLQPFVMRYSAPYQNLYMSGCTMQNTNANQNIRIDEMNTMKLYNGSGNNFGLIDKYGPTSSPITYEEAKQRGTIIETNAIYKDIVKPNNN